MRVAVTGATGFAGRFLVEEALAAGHGVTVLTRTPPSTGTFSGPVRHRPYQLGDAPDLAGEEAVIHAAFSHVAGRYRGGEGDDPHGFVRANLDGTRALVEAATSAGVARLIFLSSRAVYGAYPPGTCLPETHAPRPDTLYGEVKHAAERTVFAAAATGLVGASLRATGLYGPAGPGRTHKWRTLFADFRAGRPVAPRVGTELHGADMARAAMLLLSAPGEAVAGRAFNASDIRLDRHDLLAMVAELVRSDRAPPSPSDAEVSPMATGRLRALGWRPGGLAALRATLPALLDV